MPIPIQSLVASSDCLFRDVTSRHQDQVSTTGNLIQRTFHHVTGGVANVSAVEVVSLDDTNAAQIDFFLRTSTAPLGTITTADIAEPSSMLSIRPDITSIRSANLVVGNVTATNISVASLPTVASGGVAKLDNVIIQSFRKTLGANPTATSTICTINNSKGAYGVELNVAQSESTASVAKTYTFSIHDISLPPALLVPLSSSSSTDWGVQISIFDRQTFLRLVRLSGSTTTNFECSLTVFQSRSDPVTIVASSSETTSSSVTTTLYNNTVLTQVSGNVGIGTTTPTTALTVAGAASMASLVVSDDVLGNVVGATNRITNPSILGQGAYMAWSHQGDGYTDFICKKGGGAGGYNFYNSSGNGSNFEVGKTLLATLDSQGITMSQGTFSAPGSIVGSLFLTGKNAALNGGVTISPLSPSRSVNGTGNVTIATITYTPRSTSSVLSMNFDAGYAIGGHGTDVLRSRIHVDNSYSAMLKHQYFAFSGGIGSGTRSNTILPISAVVKNQAIAVRTFEIQVNLADTDDQLFLSQDNWTFELLERQT